MVVMVIVTVTMAVPMFSSQNSIHKKDQNVASKE
jgi:hypothetical protein